MKIKDLCKLNGFNQKIFEDFLLANKGKFKYKIGISGFNIEDSDAEKIIAAFREEFFLREEDIKRAAEEDQAMKKAMAEMLVTSGFSFDGYKITRYSGYISGDDCITLPRDDFWGSNRVADNLCGALTKIRRHALKELKEAAYHLGCNAVIGVDFDYMTMDPQHSAALNAEVTVYEPYVICVTANGNAVVIEKEE